MPEIISRSEAKRAGKVSYFTGKPCAHGHIAPRNTKNKGCLVCRSKIMARWRERNHQRSNEISRQSYRRHAEQHCAKKRKAQKENPEHFREIGRRWRRRHPDKALKSDCARSTRYRDPAKARAATKRWREKNLEKSREKRRLHRLANIEKYREKEREYTKANLLKMRVKNGRRRALKIKAEGVHTEEDIQMIFAKQKGRCAYCRGRLKAYTVDHIKPLVKGGSNWPRNLQLCCRSCNSKKGVTEPEQFARRAGLLI